MWWKVDAHIALHASSHLKVAQVARYRLLKQHYSTYLTLSFIGLWFRSTAWWSILGSVQMFPAIAEMSGASFLGFWHFARRSNHSPVCKKVFQIKWTPTVTNSCSFVNLCLKVGLLPEGLDLPGVSDVEGLDSLIYRWFSILKVWQRNLDRFMVWHNLILLVFKNFPNWAISISSSKNHHVVPKITNNLLLHVIHPRHTGACSVTPRLS